MIKFSIATCKQQTHASKPQRIQDYFHKKKKKNRIRYLALLERRHLKSHHHLNVETLNQRQRTEIELFSVRSFVRSHLSRAHCSIGTRFLNDRIATQSRQNNRQITEPHTHTHTHTHETIDVCDEIQYRNESRHTCCNDASAYRIPQTTNTFT
jgi:hypothetical protein